MGSLIVPEGKLIVDKPIADGLVTELGYARDYRPDAHWRLQSAEYIEPLRAVAPIAELVPRDMDEWNVYGGFNSSIRWLYPDWAEQAKSLQFTDGSLYETLDSSSVCLLKAGEWSYERILRCLLVMVRNVPPPGQGILPQVVLEGPAMAYNWVTKQWCPGRFGLLLPLSGTEAAHAADCTAPVMYYINDADRPAGGTFNIWDHAYVLSEAPAPMTARQGAQREVWIIEVEPHPFQGCWVLVRNLAAPREWWSLYRPDMVVVSGAIASQFGWEPEFDGRWTMSISGAITTVNISPLRYTTRAAMMRPTRWAIRRSGPWAGSTTYGAKYTTCVGWSVTCAGVDPLPGRTDVRQVPEVTAQVDEEVEGAVYRRPLIWYAYEDTEPVIANASSDSVDTSGDHVLFELEIRKNWEWRGAQAQASFAISNEALYESWQENGKVEVHLGWSSDADEELRMQRVATGYIPAGGLRRSAQGEVAGGRPQLSVYIEDGWGTRVEQTEVVDARQAGGRTVAEWLHSVGHRLGWPDAMIEVDAEVAYRVIPPAILPSEPSCAPRDGQSWAAHIDEVCDVTGIRVGLDKDGSGKLFADAGPPQYYSESSTIALELDWQADTLENRILRVEAEGTTGQFRNACKITIADSRWWETVYWLESLETREAGIGADWWKHYDASGMVEAAQVLKGFWRDYYRRASEVTWTMPLRPDLQPDDFVRISNMPRLGLPASGVYQITEHTMQVSGRDPSRCTSTFRAILVVADDPLTAAATLGDWDREWNTMPAPDTKAALGAWRS